MTDKIIDGITSFILIILALSTARDIVLKFFSIEPNTKIGKIFYNKYDKLIIEQTFKEFGLKKGQLLYSPTLRQRKIATPEKKLVSLISKYTHFLNNTVQYGENTPINTNYYINTMEASHNKDDLTQMVELIIELISYHAKFDFDFILTSKKGNVLLNTEISADLKKVSIFRKSDRDSSKIVMVDEEHGPLIDNFEGVKGLNNCSQAKKYKGIVIDCNASGGKEILKTMDEFNTAIDTNKLNDKFEKIKSAFILFRVDSIEDIDNKFSEKGYSLFRYFDLTEDIKSKIKNKSGKVLSVWKNKDLRFIDNIILTMMEQNLIRTQIDINKYKIKIQSSEER